VVYSGPGSILFLHRCATVDEIVHHAVLAFANGLALGVDKTIKVTFPDDCNPFNEEVVNEVILRLANLSSFGIIQTNFAVIRLYKNKSFSNSSIRLAHNFLQNIQKIFEKFLLFFFYGYVNLFYYTTSSFLCQQK